MSLDALLGRCTLSPEARMEWATTSTILRDLGDYANRASWDRFALHFEGPLQRFGRRMGLSRADAEDAAQETLLAFAERYRQGHYDPERGRLRQWLFGIAFRQCLAKRRNVGRHGGVVSNDQASSFWDGVPAEETASALWEREWEQAVMKLCLEQVRAEVEPATLRAFEVVMRQGRTPAEAAETLGVPVKSVYNAKFTVLKRMRELRSAFEDAV